MAGWSVRASMPWARRDLIRSSFAQTDSKIWVCGGYLYEIGEQVTHAVYDPATNTWTSKAPYPDSGRGFTYARGTSNQHFAVGGHGPSTKVWQYQIGTNTWYAQADMAVGRYWAGVETDETHIYIVGGSTGSFFGTGIPSVEKYNIATNAKTLINLPSNLPTTEFVYGSYAMHNGMIHGVRGVAFIGSSDGYIDPASGTWTNYAIQSARSPSYSSTYQRAVKGKYDSRLWYSHSNSQDNIDHVALAYRDLTPPYDTQYIDWRTPLGAATITGRAEVISPDGFLYVLGGTTNYEAAAEVARVDRYDLKISTPPTLTAPAQGATVNNDLTTLGGTIISNGEPVTLEFQLATDAAFTQNVRSVTAPKDLGVYDNYWLIPPEGNAGQIYHPATPSYQYGRKHYYDGHQTLSGPVSRKIRAGVEELFQGTWYIRSRVYSHPLYSPWTAVQSFVVAHPPAAALQFPVSRALHFGANGDVIFQWLFSDTSETDYQTSYQIIVERNDTGALLLDTGKVASQVARSYSWSLPSANKDFTIRWRMRVWDSDDVAGVYTPYSVFTMSDLPDVSITAPGEAEEVDNGTPTVSWNFTASGGRTQGTYRVRFYNVNDVLQHDSGIIVSTEQIYIPAEQAVGVGAFYVTVDVTDNGGLANSDTVNFTTAYDTPAEVAFNVTISNYPTEGYVSVNWTNAQQDDSWSAYRVYRRLSGTSSWELVYETLDALSIYEYRDYSIGSNVSHDYVVVQAAIRFGQPMESVKANPQSVQAKSSQYWLVDRADETNNILLSSVNDESFTEEWEQETLKVIGRGNHKDYGTRFGYSGTLGVRFRGSDARINRLKLELLKAQQAVMLLRNPFGDVWQVALGDVSISRIAGTGTDEHVDVTIPYEEVI